MNRITICVGRGSSWQVDGLDFRMSAVFSESGEEKECVDVGKVKRDAEVSIWLKKLLNILDFCSEKGYSTDNAIHAVPSGSPVVDSFNKDFYISISQIFHLIISFSWQQSSFGSFYSMFVLVTHTDRNILTGNNQTFQSNNNSMVSSQRIGVLCKQNWSKEIWPSPLKNTCLNGYHMINVFIVSQVLPATQNLWIMTWKIPFWNNIWWLSH